MKYAAEGTVLEFTAYLGELSAGIQQKIIEAIQKLPPLSTPRSQMTVSGLSEDQRREMERVMGAGERKYTVRSATAPGTRYTITVGPDGKKSCTCVGFTMHRKCHHINEPNTWSPL